ncbi:MAG TPA: DUF3180 domain-containing protein [Corynebacteriales bacterium]|nr:DUF3180 domain-containing protein [Mycobacteriales bacterium]
MTDPQEQPELPPEDDNRMHLTSISSLVVCAAVATLLTWLLVRFFYSSLADFSITVSLPILILAVVDFVLAWYIRRSIKDNKLGQDRHQLHPLHAARALAMGRASAWAGAVFVGVGVGSGLYVWPRADVLMAAKSDTPGVIAFAVTGLLLAIGGLVLERSCRVPPSGIEGEKVNGAATAS